MNLYALVFAGTAALGSYAATAWFSYRAGKNSCEASASREERVALKAGTAAAEKAAEAISKLKVTHETIRQDTIREVVERPVYRECRHSPDGLRNINAALTATEPRTDSGAVPPVDAPTR